MKMDLKTEHAVIAILLIAIVGFATGIIVYDESGLHIGTSSLGAGGFFDNGDNSTGQPSGDPYIPSDAFLNLEVTPLTLQRGDMVTLTVTSNMRNVPIIGSVAYQDGTNTWVDSTNTVYLDSSGRYRMQQPSENAGEWKLKVECTTNGLESNIEPHTCLGITIYQEKDQWAVGETYTGFLTGTYKTWLVLFFFKNHSDTAWEFVTVARTNGFGVIPYGTVTAGPIVAEQVGLVKDVLAIVEVLDPDAETYLPGVFEEYQSDTIPGSALDSLEAQGHIVKSNILTATIVE